MRAEDLKPGMVFNYRQQWFVPITVLLDSGTVTVTTAEGTKLKLRSRDHVTT